MIACSTGAAATRRASPTTQWLTIVGFAIAYAVAMFLVNRLERRKAMVSAGAHGLSS
jgi:hypothetical protein